MGGTMGDNFWQKKFPLGCIRREDLRCEYTEKQVLKLTDSDMATIAKEIAEGHKTFWQDLKTVVDKILAGK